MSELGNLAARASLGTSHRRAALATLARLLSGAFFVLASLASSWGVVPAAGATKSAKASIEISGGPAVVELGTTVPLLVSFHNIPTSSYLEALIYPRLQSRSALEYMQSNGVGGYPLGSSIPLAISSLAKVSGVATIPFQVSATTPASTSNSVAAQSALAIELPGCSQGCDGVYPVVFAAINDGATIATKVLPMAVLAASQPGIVPLGIAMSLDASGIPTSRIATALPALASLLARTAQQSLTLKLSALDISVAAQSSNLPLRNAIRAILAWAQTPGHQLIATDIVPVNLAALGASGLNQYFADELRLANQLVGSVGGPRTPSTYLTSNHLDTAGLKTLASAGITRLVTSASSVVQPNLKYTLTAGLRLQVDQGPSFATLVVDPQLQSDVASGGTIYEATNLAVADMVQVFEDEPNDPSLRVLAMNLNASSPNQIATAASLLAGVAGGIVLRSYSDSSAIDALLAQNPLSSWQSTSVLRVTTRPMATARRFKAGWALLHSFSGATSDKALVSQLELGLYAALSSQLPTAQSTHAIDAVVSEINSILSSVGLPKNRVVTLTSSRATIPVAVTSHEKVPLELRLTLSSDRLRIVGGGTQLIKVGAATNTASFVIDTKTLGIFQASLALTTPDGKVAISTTNLQIRSLTFTLAGTLLTVAALGVLALWWIRTLRKGRSRNRTLVPHPPESRDDAKT